MPAAIPRACRKCRKAHCDCPTHSWNNKRNKKQLDKLYHCKRWRTLRLQVLRRDGYLCQACLKEGRKTEANQCDHIVSASLNISRFYDSTNLQSLCAPCHRSKTAKVDSKSI